METFSWIALIVLPVLYVYMAVFNIKDTIISKLSKLHIYYSTESELKKGDWDSLNHSNFIKRAPVLFVLLINAAFLLGLPFIAGLFSVILFGAIPDLDINDPYQNLRIFGNTIVAYYLTAVVAIIYHLISFPKYKEIASIQ